MKVENLNYEPKLSEFREEAIYKSRDDFLILKLLTKRKDPYKSFLYVKQKDFSDDPFMVLVSGQIEKLKQLMADLIQNTFQLITDEEFQEKWPDLTP